MATIPSGLTKIIVGFSDLFSKRAWPLVQVLLTGAIVTVGPRTVTAVLRVMGLSQEKQFQKYHRVLNRVKWSTLAGSRRLLGLLVDAFVPEGPLLMALDDTIAWHAGPAAAQGSAPANAERCAGLRCHRLARRDAVTMVRPGRKSRRNRYRHRRLVQQWLAGPTLALGIGARSARQAQSAGLLVHQRGRRTRTDSGVVHPLAN
jgi:hypothetical protein